VTPPRPVAPCTYDAEASLFNNKKKEQIMGLDIYAFAVRPRPNIRVTSRHKGTFPSSFNGFGKKPVT